MVLLSRQYRISGFTKDSRREFFRADVHPLRKCTCEMYGGLRNAVPAHNVRTRYTHLTYLERIKTQQNSFSFPSSFLLKLRRAKGFS